MQPEKSDNEQRPTTSSAPAPPRPTTDPGAAVSERPGTAPGVAPPPPQSPGPPPVAASGSIPPPPPSARPIRERPITSNSSPLPPPVSQRPRLPKAPPLAKVNSQHNTDELKRLEEENYSLRKRLSAQREETRVEHKNVERLRQELAAFKNHKSETSQTVPAPNPAPTPAPVEEQTSAPVEEQIQAPTLAAEPEQTTPSTSEIDRREFDRAHAELDRLRAELKSLKEAHVKETAQLKSAQIKELNHLKNQHAIELRKAQEPQVAPPSASLSTGDDADSAQLQRQIADLKEKTTSFRQKNTELREKNGALENEVRQLKVELEQAASAPAPAAQPAPTGGFDDLTELKGIGPKFAKALRAAGVTTFKQIAEWGEADIDKIAPKLKTKPERIRKSDWVGEAKKRL